LLLRYGPVALAWGDLLVLAQRLCGAVRLGLVVPVSGYPRPAFSIFPWLLLMFELVLSHAGLRPAFKTSRRS
jgi:hypothetical protein